MDYSLFDESVIAEIKVLIMQKILKKFIVNSNNKIKDGVGRMFTIEDWAKRDYRTAIAKDLYLNTMNLAKEYEHDEFQISSISDSSELCRPFQNKCYSKSGDTFPPLEQALYPTGGVLHPNCRHFIDPYFRGISKLEDNLPPNKEIKANYDNRKIWMQTTKSLEKATYKLENAIKCNLPSDEIQTHQQSVDFWQKRVDLLEPPITAEFLL